MTRCKVLCNSVVMYAAEPREVTCYTASDAEETWKTWPRQFSFSAVYDMSTPEDQRFNRATPWAEFKLNVDNPDVSFVPGQYYYVDFAPAE